MGDEVAVLAGVRAIAVEREGFQNYPREWWHYTLRPEPSPDVAYDFPVR